MLSEVMMQEIAQLKKDGYSRTQVCEHFERMGLKPPSKPTLRKYFGMESVPEIPGAKLIKVKAFDVEPYRSVIVNALNGNPGCCISSIHDVLEEKFISTGMTEKLPGNQQTLRNFVRHLISKGEVSTDGEHGRIYDHVFDTPPGQQLLLDFGQEKVAPGVVIHFICLLLRYSRNLAVFAQDHKYDAVEACRAIYRGFQQFGGRPSQLVIDQDAVFVATETYGEVIKTRVFEAFCKEQDLTLWTCNKADPQSKGPIENSVKFVKTNYFSARKIACVEDVWSGLSSWVERKNRRIHQATYRVPEEVFKEIEQPALRPVMPSFYETNPMSFNPVLVKDTPYILYKTGKYSVPRDYCHCTVLYKAAAGNLHIYDKDRVHICTHAISECKGSFNLLPEHKKSPATNWQPVAERLRAKWNCVDFQHFLNGFKKENPRHLCQQLAAVEKLLDTDNPQNSLVAEVMAECCRLYRYQFSQFHAVYDVMRAGCKHDAPPKSMEVSERGMDAYQKAFETRCIAQEVV